ncbi:methyl-accepting chemotaxis protein [Scandinavium goeteborgense]|uniref:Methyl-accepting chemotaxis protein n=1 Tax=Scandinavium goeteborgense TaxID=1851514 RepID=A0A4R6EKV2_SCAGO|nr:methyl-accepting chemotaxis protein [Scandinavium goeteborgense]TDN59436.1 methyl-accepting chemotaxis protein [Scandinavium goeteborgense]
MLLTVFMVFLFFTLLVVIQYYVMPHFIKSEGDRIRHQVDSLAFQLREQLDRVEAQQRSMTENVVTLKSYTLDKSLPGGGDVDTQSGLARNFFNALVKELGDRLGGRVWIVDVEGNIVGEASGAGSLQSSLSDNDLPMAVPLRTLLAQSGEALRQTRFRTASGEHTLIVQPLPETEWLLAIDIPTRHLGERPTVVLHKPWPLATLVLVSTLTLLRSLNQHIGRLNEELPSQLKNDVAAVREKHAHLPPLIGEMGLQANVIAGAAIVIAQKNELLLQRPEENANRVAMLAESVMNVVQSMQALHQAVLQIADSAGILVQLSSRAYSYALHDDEDVFAVEARNLAQRSARSSKELRALVTDAVMQAQSGSLAGGQSHHVLIEEVYTVANALIQRSNG